MFDTSSINYVAIAVASVISFLVGWLWYSPLLFAKPWMAALGKTKEQLSANSSRAMVGNFALIIIIAAALDVFFSSFGVYGTVEGLEAGIFIGLFFVAANALSEYLFTGWSMRLFWIQEGYRVVMLATMGAILGWYM